MEDNGQKSSGNGSKNVESGQKSSGNGSKNVESGPKPSETASKNAERTKAMKASIGSEVQQKT